jgi:hypothetical protein
MAQHDYIISNQTFPNTRADLNNALQAIATNNSGSSAPTTLYAGQFWLDTNTPSSTTWSLYIHDGSDNILFAEIDTSANTVNFTDSALDVVTDTTPQLGGNLDTNGNNINFGNNDKANFGASNELQIYKATGGNSYIQETGTSNLRICGTEVFLRDGADTENLAIFRTNGANELYYDNSKKLETTSGGVDVTGTVTTDGLNVSGTSTLTGDVSVSGELNMTGTGTSPLDYAGTAISARWLNSSPVFESIFSATREGDISLYHNGSKKLETTSTGVVISGVDDSNNLIVGNNNTNFAVYTDGTVGEIRLKAEDGSGSNFAKFMTFYTSSAGSVASERMRIDSSGNVLVGKTSADSGGSVGTELLSGRMFLRRSGGAPLIVDRDTSDGDIILLRRAGTTNGVIGIADNDLFIGKTDGGNDNFLRFGFSSYQLIPCTSTGAVNDDVMDLGTTSSRFDNIFATNGTIQTSDQNEKQSIQSLTASEMAVAQRISKLFKTFKWNSAVEEKGDSARTHTGIIAQDVQQTFADEGLDASNYGMFISQTWWEKEISDDAVAPQEAVYETQTDEEGNEIQVLVQEAVEGQDAYTYMDTKEEATEGYTEKTRLGIRYPELLSFVSSAFEQRLTDIETRLTTLET